jgi:hypothetical protein
MIHITDAGKIKYKKGGCMNNNGPGKNPIINYIQKEHEHIMPEELFDEMLPIINDRDVDAYLTSIANMCVTGIQTRDTATVQNALRLLVLSTVAVGYLYGQEGNKTPEDIATNILKDLNIREGK